MADENNSSASEMLRQRLEALTPKSPPVDRTLAELDDLLRSMPLRPAADAEGLPWRGRVLAVLSAVDSGKYAVRARMAVTSLNLSTLAEAAWNDLVALIHEARYALKLRSPDAAAVAVGASQPFEYFDAVRKRTETALSEVFFVDAWINAEFVARYLPFVRSDVSVRLLVREYAAQVVPAVELFSAQQGHAIEVRKAGKFHDRMVFVDRKECFFSGASFKDGGQQTPTILVQMMDTFDELARTYEAIWAKGTTIYPRP